MNIDPATNVEYLKANDYYSTPPLATACLFHVFGDVIPHDVWEPAAGRGWISKVMTEQFGRNVVSTDLFPYANPLVDIETGVDYLKTTEIRAPAVITNPPYSRDRAHRFAEQHIDSLDFMALYVRLNFLEGLKRYELFKKHPPFVLILSRRMSSIESDYGDIKGQMRGLIDTAWYVWGKDVTPGLDWIDPMVVVAQ